MTNQRARSAIALCIVAAVSAPAGAETLQEALAAAYRSNPTLQASRYDLQAQDERIVQAKAELRPSATVELDGGYSRSILGRSSVQSNPFASPDTTTVTDSGSVVVTQPLYTGGRATADRHVAEAGVGQSREILRSSEQDLMLAVIGAYLDVRRYEAELAVWKSSVAELERIENEIRTRQGAGDLTRTDVAQGDANLQISREQLVNVQQMLDQSRADYEMLVGHAPGELAEPPALPSGPATRDAAFDLAEQRNPDLAQSRFAERASSEEVAVARSQGRPTIGLQGQATINGHTYPYRLYDQDKGYGGSVVLRVPITSGGQIESQVREARQRNSGDRMRIEAERLTVLRDVTNAWNAVASADRQIDLLTVQQKAAMTQLEGMTAEYHYGMRSTFDVLYAQQQLTNVQVSLFDYDREAYVARATLLRKVGQLEAASIATAAPVYDPAAHLRKIRNANWIPWEQVVSEIDKLLTDIPKKPMPLIGKEREWKTRRAMTPG